MWTDRRSQFRVFVRLACAVVAIAAASCTLQQYAMRTPGAIGVLLTSGQAVTLNGQPAQSGAELRSGDVVSTGPDSSARINLYSGGFVQLDENTDPELRGRQDPSFWTSVSTTFSSSIKCVINVVWDRGQIYSRETEGSTCFTHGPDTIIPHSAINLLARNGPAVLTVAEGRTSVVGAQRTEVSAGSQVLIDAQGIITQTRQLTPEEIRSVITWRIPFAFSPPPPGPIPYFPDPYPRPFHTAPESWCIQTRSIWASNPSFFTAIPTELRENNCQYWGISAP